VRRAGAGSRGDDVDAEGRSRGARHPSSEAQAARAAAAELADPGGARPVVERDVPQRGGEPVLAAALVAKARHVPDDGSGLDATRAVQRDREPLPRPVPGFVHANQPVDVPARVTHTAHVVLQPETMPDAPVADAEPRLEIQRRRVERDRRRQGVAGVRRAEGRGLRRSGVLGTLLSFSHSRHQRHGSCRQPDSHHQAPHARRQTPHTPTFRFVTAGAIVFGAGAPSQVAGAKSPSLAGSCACAWLS
jgi:hypothetical protein